MIQREFFFCFSFVCFFLCKVESRVFSFSFVFLSPFPYVAYDRHGKKERKGEKQTR
jgi:hypothetical protein